jgi:NADPH2:quinone reductase
MLSGLTRVIQPWGNIASCGMAGGIGLNTTVMPFIIRGIGLLGINSAGCPYEIRKELWRRLAEEWRPRHLERIEAPSVDLEGLPGAFDKLLGGRARGRIVVRVDGS